MILLRSSHEDRPNEVAVYLTQDQFDILNQHLNEGLDESARRQYCRAILGFSNLHERPERLIVHLDDSTRLDSADLGHDLVERFVIEQDPDIFDPDYHTVDFTFRVLDGEGERAYSEVIANSTYDAARIERALDAARLALHFSFNPPNLV